MIHKSIYQKQRYLEKWAKAYMYQQLLGVHIVYYGEDYLACIILHFIASNALHGTHLLHVQDDQLKKRLSMN